VIGPCSCVRVEPAPSSSAAPPGVNALIPTFSPRGRPGDHVEASSGKARDETYSDRLPGAPDRSEGSGGRAPGAGAVHISWHEAEALGDVASVSPHGPVASR